MSSAQPGQHVRPVGDEPHDNTLRRLLEAVGPGVLRVIAAPLGMDVPVSGTVIHDPRARSPRVDHALLLGVGVRPAAQGAGQVMADARAAGFCGVVVKCYGEPATGMAEAADAAGVALLAIDDELAWDRIETLIAATTAATVRGDHDPTGPAAGDLFALANEIASAVGGATAIEDIHQRILAYSTLPDQPIDEERRQGILGRAVPYDPGNEAHYREVYRSTGVCRFSSGSPSPRLAVAVRAGRELLGSIWVVDADGRLGEAAEQALAELCELAALCLLRARASDDLARRQRGDLLRRVLDDPGDVALAAPQLGLRLDAPVAVAAFAVASGEPDGPTAARAALQLIDLVSLHCEAHYGRHGCVLVDGTAYALLRGDVAPSTAAHRALVADIARHARDSLRLPVLAGIGSTVPGLRQAGASRREADMVLRALSSGAYDGPCPADGPSRVATIDEMQARVALLELADLVDEVPPLRRGVGPAVRAYDSAHGTAYGATLLAYFESGGNIGAMARRLNVHANTCRYRLLRAEKLFDFTPSDPDACLLLWLQLRLARS